VKAVGRGLSRVLISPLFLLYRLGALFSDGDKALHGWSQALSLLPGVTGQYLRREFYRLALPECASDCWISFGTILSKRGARIGRGAYIGTHCTLGLVTLEDDVLLASNVDVLSGSQQHEFEDPDTPIREQGGTFTRVTIGADSWIGNRSVVMADIGKGSVVGAGSVVTKPLPERSIAVGSPARVVGARGPEHGSTRGAPEPSRPGSRHEHHAIETRSARRS
jgi:acetyltransferase-like isoleucine patch superfamily enzyme